MYINSINCISIAGWNINGINSKIDDPNFISLIENHDVFFTYETFAKKGEEHFVIEGFTSTNLAQSGQHKNATRNSGGISVFIKNELTDHIIPVKTTAEHFIWLKIKKALTGLQSDIFCCGAYIQPHDSPIYTRLPDLDLFSLLGEDINFYKNQGFIMFTGDLNARIGQLSDCPLETFSPIDDDPLTFIDIIDVPSRCTMDYVKNSWGKELIDLCFVHDLCILNGRTLGDLKGQPTFYTKKSNSKNDKSGTSVIDIAVTDKQLRSSVLSFKVHPKNEFPTNHCLIETKIACKPRVVNPTQPPTDSLKFKKYTWDPDSSHEKLTHALHSIEVTELANKISSNTYPTTKDGVDQITSDFVFLSKILHEKSCKISNIGKKRKCKRKKQSWYTPDCESLRKRVRRAGNFLNKHPFNIRAREEYFVARRQYNRKIKQTKKTAQKESISLLMNSLDKREMWSLLSDLRGGKKTTTSIDTAVLEDHFKKILFSPHKIPKEKLDLIEKKLDNFLANSPASNFSTSNANYTDTSTLSPSSNSNSNQTSSLSNTSTTNQAPSPTTDQTNSTFPTTISPGYDEHFILKMGKTLKNGKSAFTDGSINEVIKISLPSLAPLYSKFFNLIETAGIYPTEWKNSFLVPLHKKGPANIPDNYRGLAVGSNLGKFFTKCFNEKLKSFCENTNSLAPQQFGFRENFRTTDAIFVLHSAISSYKNVKKPIFACFVDFSKAFDSVFRPAMLYKLGEMGIKGNYLQLIQSMYVDSSYIIKNNGTFSSPIKSNVGVKQGCNLSPLLFNIFVNDIHQIFDKTCFPLDINSFKLSSVSFADDLVILSESEIGLQNSLVKLDTYCKNWGLTINAGKTKVVVFNKPFTKKIRNLNFHVGDNIIEVKSSYTYLGIEISNTGAFFKSHDNLYKKAIRAQYSVYSSLDVRADTPNAPIFLRLFDSLLKPIILYGSEIWGVCKLPKINENGDFDTQNCSSGIKTVDKFVNKFFRTLLGVPNTCSTVGIHRSLGRLPIKINIFKSMIKYWFRLVTLPKSRLVSHCYWSLFNNANTEDSWICSIKNIIDSSGLSYIWSDQKSLQDLDSRALASLTTNILKSLECQFLQNANSEIRQQSKLHLFKNIDHSLKPAQYLSVINSREERSLFSNLRLGTLKLEIETGRYDKIDKGRRFCRLCDSGKIENECHFLFDCPALTIPRSPILENIIRMHPRISQLSTEDKIKFLFFNNDLDTPTLMAASNLLQDLFRERKNLFNELNII